jgi:hypothetical protein
VVWVSRKESTADEPDHRRQLQYRVAFCVGLVLSVVVCSFLCGAVSYLRLFAIASSIPFRKLSDSGAE